MKKIIVTVMIVAAISCIGIGAAAKSVGNHKAEKVAELTGKSVESVVMEKVNSGKTYGTIAAEAGVRAEFCAVNGNGNGECLGDPENCPNNGQGLCDGSGNGNGECLGDPENCPNNGQGLCDGSGNGQGNGNCDGSGDGQSHGNGGQGRHCGRN